MKTTILAVVRSAALSLTGAQLADMVRALVHLMF
jgi:hypothetical protein